MNKIFKTFQKVSYHQKLLRNINTDISLKKIYNQQVPVQQPSVIRNTRHFTSNANALKVTVIGGAGKIGQALCLMLKQSPLIDELCIFDVKPTSGLAKELEHIDTNCKVSAFTGKESIGNALQDSKVVVMLAAAQDADVMPFDRMWTSNAFVVKEIVTLILKSCPRAFLAIGTSPINSLVPMASEILKKGGCYNPKMVFGITTLDTVRANTFVAQVQGLEPECVMVPVVGGHSEETIIPVLSKATPCAEFTNEELESITISIRKTDENILNLKPPDTAPLSSAFASARFIISLVKAIRGYPDITECAYVYSKAHPQLKYLSTPLLLGPSGVARNLGVPHLSDYETCMFDNAIPCLVNDIKRGEKFVGVVDPPPCDICDPNPNAPRCPRNWCELKRR